MGRNQRVRQAAAQRTRRRRIPMASAVTVAVVVAVFQLVGNDHAQATD